MTHVVRKDTYGNTYIIFSANPSVVELTFAITDNESDKAIIVVNVDQNTINKYNKIQNLTLNQHAIYQATHPTNKFRYYLIRNNSSCPELCNGSIFGAGVSILIKRNNNFYILLHKDGTRPLLTCPGGTGNRDEFREFCLNPDQLNFHKRIAQREVHEETSGIIKLINGDELKHTMGLQLKFNKMTPLIKATMITSIFEVPNVTDTFVGFGYVYDETDDEIEENKEFLDFLFDDSHKEKDNENYTLHFSDHPETEFIHAMKINSTLVNTASEEELAKAIAVIRTNLPTFAVYNEKQPRISTLALLYSHICLNNLNNLTNAGNHPHTFDNIEFLKKIGMPPNIQQLNLF